MTDSRGLLFCCIAGLAAAVSCAGPATESSRGPALVDQAPQDAVPGDRALGSTGPPNAREPVTVARDGTYLQPNVIGPDGKPGFLHVRESDMPWVVAIGYPKRPAKYASRKGTRQRAIDAIKLWESAIRPEIPWFRLAFVEEDPEAPVQVEWKRRVTGPWAGFGGIRYWGSGASLRVGGHMEVSTTPSHFATLKIDDLELLVAHEFGHVLGLGHCLECDSAMNYAYASRGRIIVTPLDVRTFVALVSQPNAF